MKNLGLRTAFVFLLHGMNSSSPIGVAAMDVTASMIARVKQDLAMSVPSTAGSLVDSITTTSSHATTTCSTMAACEAFVNTWPLDPAVLPTVWGQIQIAIVSNASAIDYSTFTENLDTTAHLGYINQIVVAGRKSANSVADIAAYDLSFMSVHTTGTLIPQSTIDRHCHDCWLCCTCCDDTRVTRAFTTAEITEITQAMGGNSYNQFMSELTPGVFNTQQLLPRQKPPATVALQPPTQKLVSVTRNMPALPEVEGLFDDLGNIMGAFLNSPDVRREINTPTKNDVVKHVQDSLSSLSEDASCFKLAGIKRQHVADVVETLMPATASLNETKALVAAVLASHGNGSSKWQSSSSVAMNKTKLSYYKLYWSSSSSQEFNFASCELDTQFAGTELKVVQTTTYDIFHNPIVHDHIVHSPMSANDTKRVILNLEYMCDSNIKQILDGAGDTLGFHMQYHDNMLQAVRSMAVVANPGEYGGEGDKAWQALKDTCAHTHSLLDSIGDAIGGFIEHSDQSAKIIHRAGEFTRWVSTATGYVLQGVTIPNFMTAVQQMITLTLDNVPQKTIDQIKLLAFGGKNSSSWMSHHVMFNATTGGIASTMMVEHTVRDGCTDGECLDLSFCAIKGTFQVLGDLEVIYTTNKYLGGLITGGTSVSTKTLPPTFTSNDSVALINYMAVGCQNVIAKLLHLPAVGQPPIP